MTQIFVLKGNNIELNQLKKSPNSKSRTNTTKVSHSTEPFVTQPSHPFSPKWQWFDNSHEYQILNLHEDSQMTFYKYLSEIHQKSAKDLGRLKNEGQVQFAIFLLSHSTCLLSPFFPPLSHRHMSTVWLDWKKKMTKKTKIWQLWLKTSG